MLGKAGQIRLSPFPEIELFRERIIQRSFGQNFPVVAM